MPPRQTATPAPTRRRDPPDDPAQHDRARAADQRDRRLSGRVVLLVGCAALFGAACGAGSTAHSISTTKPDTVLTASFDAAGASDRDALEAILLQRFRAIGARNAVVDVDFGRHLVHVRLPAGEVPPPATQRVVMQTAELRFRPVLYNPGGEPLIFPFSARPTGPAGSTGFPGCEALLEKSPPDNDSARDVVLPDRERKYCYVLGPAAVTGAGIRTSGTVYDSTQSQWVVLVSFKNNDFLDKVAQPYVGKQIAIELDGVVQSAPTVQPGITGRDVQITGQFTKSEAEDLALVLRYGALPVQLHFVSAAAAG